MASPPAGLWPFPRPGNAIHTDAGNAAHRYATCGFKPESPQLFPAQGNLARRLRFESPPPQGCKTWQTKPVVAVNRTEPVLLGAKNTKSNTKRRKAGSPARR